VVAALHHAGVANTTNSDSVESVLDTVESVLDTVASVLDTVASVLDTVQSVSDTVVRVCLRRRVVAALHHARVAARERGCNVGQQVLGEREREREAVCVCEREREAVCV